MAGCKPVLKIEGATAPQIHSYANFQRARHSQPYIFNFCQKGPTLVSKQAEEENEESFFPPQIPRH